MKTDDFNWNTFLESENHTKKEWEDAEWQSARFGAITVKEDV